MSSEPEPEPEPGSERRDLEERIRALARINQNLCEQIAYLSDLYMTTNEEKRRLDRRYLVVRPIALVKKLVFLWGKRRERIRIERGLREKL